MVCHMKWNRRRAENEFEINRKIDSIVPYLGWSRDVCVVRQPPSQQLQIILLGSSSFYFQLKYHHLQEAFQDSFPIVTISVVSVPLTHCMCHCQHTTVGGGQLPTALLSRLSLSRPDLSLVSFSVGKKRERKWISSVMSDSLWPHGL